MKSDGCPKDRVGRGHLRLPGELPFGTRREARTPLGTSARHRAEQPTHNVARVVDGVVTCRVVPTNATTSPGSAGRQNQARVPTGSTGVRSTTRFLTSDDHEENCAPRRASPQRVSRSVGSTDGRSPSPGPPRCSTSTIHDCGRSALTSVGRTCPSPQDRGDLRLRSRRDPFGYNASDDLPASAVLADNYERCTGLLVALPLDRRRFTAPRSTSVSSTVGAQALSTTANSSNAA